MTIIEFLASLHNLSSDLRAKINLVLHLIAVYQGRELRDSGEPVLEHPCDVMRQLMDMDMPDDVIIAAGLHDMIEDTVITFEILADLFGVVGANRVAAQSKKPKEAFPEGKAARLAEMHARWIAAGEIYSDSIREEIERKFKIRIFDHYGLCEVYTGIAYECEFKKGLHVLDDYVITEIIDPKNGQVLPPETDGELVLTSLRKEASPVIRYRTGDITSLKIDRCPCGRKSTRIDRIKRRVDDLFFVKGIKIDPHELQDMILETAKGKIYRDIQIKVDNKFQNLRPEILVSLKDSTDTEILELIQKSLKNKTLLTFDIKHVEKKLFKVLKKAGLYSLSLGVESGNQRALNTFRKGTTVAQNAQAVKILNELGIVVMMGFIGFGPYSSVNDLRENYFFLKKYCRNCITNKISLSLYVHADDPITKELIEKGIVNGRDFPNYTYEIQDPKARRIYKLLHRWNEFNEKVYNKTIDPLSAPRIVSEKNKVAIHSLVKKLRSYDLEAYKFCIDKVTEDDDYGQKDFEKEFMSKFKPKWNLIKSKINKIYKEENY